MNVPASPDRNRIYTRSLRAYWPFASFLHLLPFCICRLFNTPCPLLERRLLYTRGGRVPLWSQHALCLCALLLGLPCLLLEPFSLTDRCMRRAYTHRRWPTYPLLVQLFVSLLQLLYPYVALATSTGREFNVDHAPVQF